MADIDIKAVNFYVVANGTNRKMGHTNEIKAMYWCVEIICNIKLTRIVEGT
jgi:hypothetical protein